MRASATPGRRPVTFQLRQHERYPACHLQRNRAPSRDAPTASPRALQPPAPLGAPRLGARVGPGLRRRHRVGRGGCVPVRRDARERELVPGRGVERAPHLRGPVAEPHRPRLQRRGRPHAPAPRARRGGQRGAARGDLRRPGARRRPGPGPRAPAADLAGRRERAAADRRRHLAAPLARGRHRRDGAPLPRPARALREPFQADQLGRRPAAAGRAAARGRGHVFARGLPAHRRGPHSTSSSSGRATSGTRSTSRSSPVPRR